MKAGAKPKHAFNSLKVGEKALLKGSAKIYPHQYINQYNKKRDEKLRVITEGGRIYAERIM